MASPARLAGLGFALLCHADGSLQEILHDDLALHTQIKVGESFLRLIDPGSIQKGLNFLQEVQSRAAAFQWDMNVRTGQGLRLMQFAATQKGRDLVIVAAPSEDETMALYADLAQMHNEQMTTLRLALKAQSDASRQKEEATREESHYLDELTTLNNELVNLQRELSKKNVELQRLNDLKNQFLGMAAHDLRNPLSVILAYSDFLRDEAQEQLTPDQLEFVEEIQASSQFMLALINELLNISVIESGRLQLNTELTDVGGLVSRVAQLNRRLADQKEILLQVELPSTPLTMEIDALKIQQVLNNLLTNGIKFSHPKTQILVTTQIRDQVVEITVQDHGQGIPANELERLFKPFSRTSVRTTGGESSTGLGLVISRRIVEGHGGSIWVKSQVGQGSTFGFTLPFQPQTPPPSAQRVGHLQPQLENKPVSGGTGLSNLAIARVLIVSDAPDTSQELTSALDGLVQTVHTVTLGEAALDALAIHPTDLLFVDLGRF